MFLGDSDQHFRKHFGDKFWPDTPLEFVAMGYYGMALHKTVPENRNTVTRLDREEDEISTTLGRSSNEKTYAKELKPACTAIEGH